MTTPKPLYSRPSDDDPTPTPKKRQRRHGRRRKGLHTTEQPTATIQDDALAKRDPTTTPLVIVERDHLQDDGDGVVKRHPTTGTHHTRNRRTHQRAKRRARELRAENELLHRRLAAIYDALSID